MPLGQLVRKTLAELKEIPRFYLVLWLLLFLLGLGGALPRLIQGHIHTAYGSYTVWGLWVSLYIWLIGLSAGAFLLSSVIYLFQVKELVPFSSLALITAITTLFCALLSIWFDLGHEWRFYYVFLYPNFTSMMAWMVWLYTAYFLLVLSELFLEMKPREEGRDSFRYSWLGLALIFAFIIGVAGVLPSLLKLYGEHTIGSLGSWRNPLIQLSFLGVIVSLYLSLRGVKPARALPLLGTVGIPVAIAFHGGVGALFATPSARPGWHSSLIPILFLTGALLSGSGLFTFLLTFLKPGKEESVQRAATYMSRILLGLLLFDLLLEWAEITIPIWYGVGERGELTYWRLILFGPYFWVFWGVHILLGALVPIYLLLRTPHKPRWVGLAGLLIAATYLAVRLNIVIPSLVIPELEQLKESYRDHRLVFDYVPNAHEWLVSLFVVAVGIALFALLWIISNRVLREKMPALQEEVAHEA